MRMMRVTRAIALRLGVVVVVGCGAPPSSGSTEASTTDSSPASSTSASADATVGSGAATSASTGAPICPPMPPEDGGYDPCPGPCGRGGQCFEDGQHAVCTRGCFVDCNCWPAPTDGDATARCSGELLEGIDVCVLDCSGGASCPRGMICAPELEICAYPYSGGSDATDAGSGSTDAGGSAGSTGVAT